MQQSTTPAGIQQPRRSSVDGLTREERRTLYQPDRYHVEEEAPGVWTVRHRDVAAVFTVRKVDTRGHLDVTSNTGHDYRVGYHERTCGCRDHQRAQAEGRPCKHLAAAEAVAAHCDRARAERVERELQSLFCLARQSSTGEAMRLLEQADALAAANGIRLPWQAA
jgi:hypothetical protein